MDRLFSTLGKIFLVVLLLIIVLSAGYYIGTNKNKSQTPLAAKDIKNDVAPKVTADPTISPSATPSPTKENNTKTISAGLSSGTSFVPYTIQVPSSWSDKHENTPTVIDKLTLSKDTYSVIIYQAAIGGGGCLYKGDPPAQMAQNFTNSVEFTSSNNTYRRSWNTDANTTHISYTICQKGSDASYSSITQFGKIDVVSPNPADDTTMKEIDSMIASIKKQ